MKEHVMIRHTVVANPNIILILMYCKMFSTAD